MANVAAGVPVAPARLLVLATRGLHEATTLRRPAERYAAAHLAALRCAAAILAARTPPGGAAHRRRRPRNAWALLLEAAPELSSWSQFFAAGAAKRAAAEAGIEHAVTSREADDLVDAVATFLCLAETTIGVVHQPALAPHARAS